MNIRIATMDDSAVLLACDRWIAPGCLRRVIADGECLAAYDDETFIGWLRWNWLWSEIPFMTMLRLTEDYRGKGFGRMLVEEWERLMRDAGHRRVMTSTQQNEYAQHFYEHLGYRAIGGFLLPEQPFEIIMMKDVT